MIHSTMLKRIVLLVLASIMLSALLTVGIYMIVVQNVYIQQQGSELKQKSETIAEFMGLYMSEDNDYSYLIPEFIVQDRAMFNAMLHIYDTSGNPILIQAKTSQENIERAPSIMEREDAYLGDILKEPLEAILEGEDVVSIYSANHSTDYLVAGTPIMVNGEVMGAVMFSKPTNELATAMMGINRTLFLSLIMGALVMMLPAYLASKRLATPINQMRDIALSMAKGDFSVRTNENQKGEIGQLGASLNYLSSQLSRTISSLVFERNRLKQILDGLNEGIIAMDSEGEITHVNPAVGALFGFPYEKLCRANVRLMIPDESLWNEFDMAVLSGDMILRNLYIEDRVFYVSIVPLENDDGTIGGVVGLFRDITEAERLEQTRRDYVANVSHELRTPLASIRALAETLDDGLIKDEELKKSYYGDIVHETLRLSRLIEDLLELSRLQSGGVALEMHKIDAAVILEDISGRYSLLANEAGLMFSCNVGEGCDEAYGNPDRIAEVIIILLDNAIKYTPSGTISLSSKRDGDKIRVSVSDTGEGIDKQDIDHVFERFYKADKAHSTEGTGLGLSIAHEIIQSMGETISVKSETGKGSTFTFTIAVFEPA